MSDIRSIHVVSAIGNEASGLYQCVPALCRELANVSVCTELLSCDLPDTRFEGVSLKTFPSIGPLREKTLRSPCMLQYLCKQAPTSNIFHNHHLWMFPNLYAAQAIRGTKCRLVTSTHGTLSPSALRISKWKKRVFWIFGQRYALSHASCVHATSEAEYRDIRKLNIRVPVAILPFGYTTPEQVQAFFSSKRRLLYLGRLNQIKGLERLLEAWSKLECRFPQWELHLVGPGEANYVDSLKERVRSFQIENVSIRPAVYGSDKLREFATADLSILPSFSENFAFTVLESLSQQTPVIATNGTPWKGLPMNRCGWWGANSVSDLVADLEAAMAIGKEGLAEMGRNGRNWIQQEFSLDSVAEKMKQVYLWCLDIGTLPDHVHLD